MTNEICHREMLCLLCLLQRLNIDKIIDFKCKNAAINNKI